MKLLQSICFLILGLRAFASTIELRGTQTVVSNQLTSVSFPVPYGLSPQKIERRIEIEWWVEAEWDCVENTQLSLAYSTIWIGLTDPVNFTLGASSVAGHAFIGVSNFSSVPVKQNYTWNPSLAFIWSCSVTTISGSASNFVPRLTATVTPVTVCTFKD